MGDSASADIGWLRQTGAVLVTEVPRPAVGRTDGDGGRQRRLAAVIGAYHGALERNREPLAVGWQRMAVGGAVGLLVAGSAAVSAGESEAGLVNVTLPPGGRGQPLPAGVLAKSLAAVPCWTALNVEHELLGPEDEHAGRGWDEVGPSLEEGLLATWDGAFATVLLAEPMAYADVKESVDQVTADVRYANARKDTSPEQALRYEGLSNWLRELREAELLGLWRVKLLVGGQTPAAVAQLSALLVASTDLSGTLYALRPAGRVGPVEQAIGGEGELAGSRLVSALAKAPVSEVPGIRLVLPSSFDTTPETASEPTALSVGTVLDRQRRAAGALNLRRGSLNRHTFVCGATGAGKSQTVRTLLEAATTQRIPWLVIEPAKSEYRRMAARLGDQGKVVVIRPGDPDLVPAGIDPLRPAPGFPLQTHIDLVKALFLAAFDANEPFPQVLSAALTRCYTELGWDTALGKPAYEGRLPRYPTLADLERTALQVVDEIGYGREVADNVRGFVKVRLASLRLGTTGRFLEGGYPLHLGRLMKANVVLELEDVGDDRDKAFLIGAVLIALTEHLRVATDATKDVRLRHLTVVEEAHRLLRHTEVSGPAAQAVEMFAAMLAEIRAYGEGLVIAEQIPSKLIPDVIKNTAVKIVHRLPARDDREAVGATMNITDDQSAYLVTLPPGRAAVFTDGMDYPVLAQLPDRSAAERAELDVTGPDRIVMPLFGRCTAAYGDPLVLHSNGEVLRARAALERSPRLRLWVELSTVAHLVGSQRPDCPESVRAELAQIPAELHEVALACAIDDAVAERSAVAVPHFDPVQLCMHLHVSLLALIASGVGCMQNEPEWRVWEKGGELPDIPTQQRVLFGESIPGWLARCVRHGRAQLEWRDAVRAAVAEVAPLRWPLEYFEVLPPEMGRGTP